MAQTAGEELIILCTVDHKIDSLIPSGDNGNSFQQEFLTVFFVYDQLAKKLPLFLGVPFGCASEKAYSGVTHD